MDDCLFCKIAEGEIDADIIYQDEYVVAFHDIAPKAPCHVLIIPRLHIATLNDITEDDGPLMAHIMQTAQQVADELKVAEDGYRVTMNCNAGGGQEVFHIHLHLLGGRQMNWPPG